MLLPYRCFYKITLSPYGSEKQRIYEPIKSQNAPLTGDLAPQYPKNMLYFTSDERLAEYGDNTRRSNW